MIPLISHEVPKALFEKERYFNDYPYILAHLLNKDKEYTDYYRTRINNSEYSILDNSAYELDGKPMSSNIMYELGEEFRPTHIVLPDKFQNCKKTCELAIDFLDHRDAMCRNCLT